MRLPNGMGSITKLSGKRRKPWVVRVPANYDDNGNEIRTPLGYYRTYSEALKALHEYNEQPIADPRITLGEVWERWTQTRSYTELAADTKYNYLASWNKRLSVLADRKIKDLRTADLQAVIDEAADAGMSKSTLSKDKALMTQLYEYAMKNDFVKRNYAELVELPRGDDTAERTPFSDEELAKIDKAVGTVPFADCVLMMCFTGFRIAEFLELKPSSYDPSIPAVTGGKKTKAGKGRVIPLNPRIDGLFRRWVEKGGQTIICRPDGKPYTPKYFRDKCYYPALEQIGVRRLVPHCTRHTFATLCEKAGLRPEEIKKLMGHTKYEMSLHYTHADLEQLKNAVSLLAYRVTNTLPTHKNAGDI